MITSFIDNIAQENTYDPAQVVGYSEEELRKIERMYDITISGELAQFMLEMGRCDGGLIGDDPIILYRTGMSVRRHVMYQLRLEFDFKEYRIEDGLKLLQYRPFLFSVEAETQYFFVATKSDNPDRVYHYDENEETVSDTGISFLEYMKRIIDYYNQPSWDVEYQGKTITMPNKRLDIVCRGELLII